jgi:hypothetical protein
MWYSEQAKNSAAGNQAAGEERTGTGFTLAIALFGLAAALDQPANRAASEDGRSGGNRDISAHGERQRANAEQLDGDHQEHSEQHQMPRQLVIENAVDHRGHQARLRRRGPIASDAFHPLNFNLVRCGIVEIFSVRHVARTDGVDQHVRFSVVDVILIFHLGARGQVREVHGDFDRFVFGQAHVHELQRAADGENRSHRADDQRELLFRRRGADQVAGFEILRSAATIGRRDAYDAADGQREHGVISARPSGHQKHRAGGH